MPTIDTVAALLAKSERTDNTDEAEAYLAKAQHLATLHAIDLATVAARAAKDQQGARLLQRSITIGEARKAANTHLVALFAAIGAANDVLVDVARNSTYVVAYGADVDIDTTEAIWLACAPRMIAGAQEWMKSRRWVGDTTLAHRRGVGVVNVPITARTAKATFMVAFTHRIAARLLAARQDAVHHVDQSAAAGNGTPGAALVLVAKAEQVAAFHRSNSDARGRWRGYSGSAAGPNSDSARAGFAAAQATHLTPARAVGATGALPPTR